MPVNQDRLEHHEEGDTENRANGAGVSNGGLEQAEAVVSQQREYESCTEQFAVSARECAGSRHECEHGEHGRHDRLRVELQGSRVGEALAYRTAGIKVKPILARRNQKSYGEKGESNFLSSCL